MALTFILISLVTLVGVAAYVDFRSRRPAPARETTPEREFAVVEGLVVGTFLAVTVATLILAVQNISSV